MTTKKASLGSLLLLLVGCGTNPVYIVPELPLPPLPILPVIFATEVACLSEETVENQAVREVRLVNHINTLRAIIETHNQGATK